MLKNTSCISSALSSSPPAPGLRAEVGVILGATLATAALCGAEIKKPTVMWIITRKVQKQKVPFVCVSGNYILDKIFEMYDIYKFHEYCIYKLGT